MEIKELVKNLNLANDINTLSIEELANKYLCNKEEYSEFIKDYSNLFSTHSLYQVRVSQQYNKITELLSYGNIMYPDKENEYYEKSILSKINYILHNYKIDGLREDEIQAKWLLNVTTEKVRNKKENKNYEQLISGMYEAALSYLKKDKSIGELENYVYFITKYENSYNKDTCINSLLSKQDISKCFNNVDFLYLANYIIKANKNLVDEEFLDDVKGIISISSMLDESKNKKDPMYKKVSKYTLNNIRKYEENKLKEMKK